MSDLSIRAERLSKKYRIGALRHEHDTLRDSITATISRPFKSLRNLRTPVRPAPNSFWALKDISFEVNHGELIGIIGRNGAGKTTLLKVLSQITEPTEGRVTINGIVGSLLEVGTGFQPELTGRENLFLNGAILGMKRAEIRRQFDEIVEFAEIGKFIDTPVKRYSSGMLVRLAFAIAAHLDTNILLMDEVLAVGDYQFQKRCLGKMGEVANQGRTVVLVSHSMPSIRNFCQRAILIDAGRIVEDGSVDSVVETHLKSSVAKQSQAVWDDEDRGPGSEVARLCAVKIFDYSGAETADIDISQDCVIQVTYKNLRKGTRLTCQIQLFDNSGNCVLWSPNIASASVEPDPWFDRRMPIGLFRSTCAIPGELLNNGRYSISVTLASNITQVEDQKDHCVSFNVVETGAMRYEYSAEGHWPGVVRPRLNWSTELVPESALASQGPSLPNDQEQGSDR